MRKRLLSVVLALSLLLCAMPAMAASALRITISGLPITFLTMDLSESDTAVLSVNDATLVRAGAVVWRSSSDKIAFVDSSGKITALKNGIVVITASAADGSRRKASLRLHVRTSMKSATLSGASSMLGTKKQTLTAAVTPVTASDKTFTWTSSNTAAATVDQNGVVRARRVSSASTVTITAVANDGSKVTAKKKITVKPCTETVSLSAKSKTLRLKQGEYVFILKAACLPTGAAQDIQWRSSNTAVVTVESGAVWAVKPGKATVTALAADGSGVKSSCKVTVTGSGLIYSTALNYLEMDWADDTGERYGVTGTTLPIKKTLAVPRRADGETVRAIGDAAFSECALPGVIMPDTVSYIGDEAFRACVKLKSARLSANLTYLGAYAFAESGLRSIELPEKLPSLEEGVFSSCKYLTEVSVPPSVQIVGDGAFAECPRLRYVKLRYGVKEIGAGAFSGCKALRKVVVPLSVTAISDDAFEDCDNVVLHVRPKSYALQYAKENNLRYTIYIP